jgi:peptide/nickel transport system permease protein
VRKFALGLLVALLLGSLWVGLRHGSSYAAQDRDAPSAASSPAHPAGTDALGRDRLTRVAVAALLGLAGATAAALAATGIAAAVGVGAAFAPRWVQSPLLLLCDAFLALPWLFLLMMVRGGLPLTAAPLVSGALTFALLGLLGWPACARAVYAGAQRLRHADWMTQGRAAGIHPLRLATVCLPPHLAPLLWPQFLVSIPVFIMAEANLGTLGLGLGEPLPSWGSLLGEIDNSVLLGSSHWVYLPLVLLVLTLLSLELLSEKESV